MNFFGAADAGLLPETIVCSGPIFFIYPRCLIILHGRSNFYAGGKGSLSHAGLG